MLINKCICTRKRRNPHCTAHEKIYEDTTQLNQWGVVKDMAKTMANIAIKGKIA